MAPRTSKSASRSEGAQNGSNGQQAPPDPRPLAGFAALVGVYGAAVAGAGVLAKKRGLPERVSPTDIALIGVATHKLARRVSKDSVTSPLRAPFTEFRGVSGPGELHEEVEGTGVRKAIGELLTCPFCIGQWIATGFTYGLVFAPRATRLVAAVFASAAIADFLQLGYAQAQQAAEGD